MVGHAAQKRGKLGFIAEGAVANRLEDLYKIWVDDVGAVSMRVPEVFYVFGEVSEEEYVGLSNFARDFDL
jgi:hypothetical protein